jgi:hypothetical protein
MASSPKMVRPSAGGNLERILTQLVGALNGDFDPKAAIGFPWKLGHNWDGVVHDPDPLSASVTVVSDDYAIDVGSQETTKKRVLAVRAPAVGIDASKAAPIQLEVTDRAKASKDGTSAPTNIIVEQTVAGGILSGTYPNPGISATGKQAVFTQGMVIHWFGSVGSIPTGWALCDGGTYGGVLTPNLIDRVIVGAGNLYGLNASGGSDTRSVSFGHTHQVAIPSHSHTMTHTHPMGTHQHPVNITTDDESSEVGVDTDNPDTNAANDGHSHNVVGNTGSGGGGDTGPASNNNTTEFSGGDVTTFGQNTSSTIVDVRQPYRALYPIMKL